MLGRWSSQSSESKQNKCPSENTAKLPIIYEDIKNQ